MLARIERKLAEVQRWVDSVDSIGSWPAAIVLALFRTRPADGQSTGARWSRKVFPHIWVRPALLQGLCVRVDPAQLSHFVIYEEVFIDCVYDLDRLAFIPDAIIDCGAFEGYFSLLTRARFRAAPIVAFEPNAANFRGLVANVHRNHLVIETRAEAVSTSDGTARFSGSGCGGRLGGGPDDVEVVVTDLRRVISELHPDQLLLKIDIEGGEATLLPALLPILPHRCAIFFEWHHGVDEYQKAADLLAANGFATELTREHRVDDATVFIDAFAQRH